MRVRNQRGTCVEIHERWCGMQVLTSNLARATNGEQVNIGLLSRAARDPAKTVLNLR